MTGSEPKSLHLRPLACLAGLLALLCLPMLLSHQATNYAADESAYHLPAIRQIRAHWPGLDLLHDSLSATAPGYHYVLAGISYLTGPGQLALRLVNFAVSLGVLALFCPAWPAQTASRTVFFALLPLAASNFFVKSASYVVTDNAALLAVAGTLLALLLTPSPRGPRNASLLSALALFIRQSGAWLLAPLLARILTEPGRRPRFRQWLPLLPSVGILGWLAISWGGLVPPIWREATSPASGLAPAAGAYLLAVLAIFGSCYYAAARPVRWNEDLRSGWSMAGVILGLGLALAGPTTPDHDAGRWGGYLWNLAGHLPVVGRYSAVFLLLAPLGGTILGMLARRLYFETGRTTTLIWLAAFLGWMGTGLLNRQIFQRYYEPTILVLLICWLLLLARVRPAPLRLDIRPLVLIGVTQVGLTLLTAHARTFGLI
jgi:hypothetical protein